MRSQASNTDKELKKDKFGTANRADTIQPKSMDGLQNHADTQKLIRVKTAAEQSGRNEKLTQFKTAAEQSNRHEKLTQLKTAAEQSNRHEKLTQLQSMGDGRAQRIQNDGVVQLVGEGVLKNVATGLGRAAMETGRAAARGAENMGKEGIRLAEKHGEDAIKLGGALATGATLANNASGIATGSITGDKNMQYSHTFKLVGTIFGESKLPDPVKEKADDLFGFLADQAAAAPIPGSTKFDDTQYQKINQTMRDISAFLTEYKIPNPLAAAIDADDTQSRMQALYKFIEDDKLKIALNQDGKEVKAMTDKQAADLKKNHPEVAAYLEENKNATDDELFHKFQYIHVEDVDDI
jgi:hypothetical protein